jgi:hypothetical protein
MSILDFKEISPIGTVISVDTASVLVSIIDENDLNKLQDNH